MYVIPISLNAVYVLTQPCICICMLMFPADVSFLMHIVRVLIASCLCVLCHIDDHIGSRYVDYEMKQIIYDDVFAHTIALEFELTINFLLYESMRHACYLNGWV